MKNLPINKAVVFGDAPGPIGMLWRNFCALENQLAELMVTLPLGTIVTLERNAWFMREVDGQLVLFHGNVCEGEIEDEKSRFDFDLSWVDVDECFLEEFNAVLHSAVLNFATLPRIKG